MNIRNTPFLWLIAFGTFFVSSKKTVGEFRFGKIPKCMIRIETFKNITTCAIL